ncbi:MAG: hypothetical protein ACYC2I_13310 [Elusimicrobiales bacterium]
MKKVVSLLFIVACVGCSDINSIRSPNKSILESPGFIYSEGRWGLLSGSGNGIVSKINTTNIVCSHKTMICSETQILLFSPQENKQSNKLLYKQDFEYEITEWGKGVIKAKHSSRAGNWELVISKPDNFAEKSFRETKTSGNPENSSRWALY